MSIQDKNARLLYLESRYHNNSARRIIRSTLNEIERSRLGVDKHTLDNMQSIKNALFLKMCGIDYEGIFQPYYINRKVFHK